MEIAELIEIALANTDQRRVEVAALEPAEVDLGVVSGLAPLIAELVDNALSFSGPEDVVRVTGLHDQGDYLISISDRGVGIPEELLGELNRLLDDPNVATTAKPGIELVARLAARHGIDVRLVPGAPGTTARVAVPGRVVSGISAEPQTSTRLPAEKPFEEVFARPEELEETVDLTRFERGHIIGSGVVAMSDEEKREAEAFLDRVFASLLKSPGLTDRPSPGSATRNGSESSEPYEPDSGAFPPAPERHGNVATLRVRVPGQNFSLVEDDPSTVAAEGAIDIRSALSRYEQGRRSAEEARTSN